MAITKVTEGVRTLGTGEVATANMATDPTNASNLSSGDVPLAQLGNAPATDLTPLEDDIAILGFKVATNGSLAKYDLVDQTQDVFQDASGIDASASTNEVRDSSNYYSGSEPQPTGGTITEWESGGTTYVVHSFLSTGVFDTNGFAGTADYLVVAGGGGGGGDYSGGGGAGGYRIFLDQTIADDTYTATVGSGGIAGSGSGVQGGDGGTSSFIGGSISKSSTGGGGGGAEISAGRPGGSGGGGDYNSAGGTGNQGGYTPVEGYAGGQGTSTGDLPAGGGGGASEVGESAPDNSTAGDGGDGLANTIRTGASVTYAGGGGGGGSPSATPGTGGAGGGGNGGTTPTVGAVNSGGGGGGANVDNGTGAAGGSGIVVVKFAAGAFGGYNNMTLVSNATTSEAVPTKGDIVLTYTNGIGTATINTDIKAYISRDNGTTYTQFTLADQGDTGGHTILTAHDLDVSAQPSGSSMRYKVETLNQSGSKATRIQAVSLGWS